ncbi:MAG TPA: hypothetical protein VFO80_08330 [Sphingomonas sp.]|nr:hypothetical protein [Sphingomonas sp.]
MCRIAGGGFILFAIVNLLTLGLWLRGPAPHTYCVPVTCWIKTEPLTLLDESDRTILATSPDRALAFDAYVAQPRVRLALAAIRAVKALPFSLMVLGIGVALRRLGGGSGNPLARALPWMRRASIAAIVWALAKVLVDSLTATVLSGGLPEGFTYYFASEWNEVGTALMLALAAYAMAWAMEAGVTAQRDLDEFV